MNIKQEVYLQIFFYFLFNSVHGFTNMLGELFSDLRFGTLESDILGRAFPGKLKCAQGSFPFNGSCYFISNKKYIEKDSNEVINYLMRIIEKKSNIPSNIAMGLDKSNLPEKARFEEAKYYCDQLEMYSSLIEFNETNAEFDFIANLLKNFTSAQSGKYYEQKYWIGLVYNTTLKWINGMDFNNPDLEILVRPSNDKYRRCAYLNVRDNGDLIIEWANCINDQHNYICKYVMDRCYNNSFCGQNGACVNLPSRQTFECRCRIFYDGERCEKWSNQGVQMIIAVTIVISAVLFLLISSIHSRINNKINERKERQLIFDKNYQLYVKQEKRKSKSYFNQKSIRYSLQVIEKNCLYLIVDLCKKKFKLVTISVLSLVVSVIVLLGISLTRYNIILKRIEKYKASSKTEPEKSIDKDNITHLTTFFSYDLCKVMRSQFLEDFVLIIVSLTLTGIIYFWNAFKCNRNHEYFCKFSKSRARDRDRSEDSRLTIDYIEKRSSANTGFLSKFIHINKLKNITICGFRCSCGIDFPVPMNPFSKRNRFLTGVIYAAYTYNILKIFEFLLVGEVPGRALSQGKSFMKSLNISMTTNLTSLNSQLNTTLQNANHKINTITEQGILMELIKQICVVIIIGLRYYPVLLCIDLKRKSKFCYLICTIYVVFLLIYYVYMNTFCLLSAYSTIKHAYKVINAEKQLPLSLNELKFSRLGKTALQNHTSISTTTKSGIKNLRVFSLLDLRKSTSTASSTTTTTTLNPDIEIKNNLTNLIGDQLFLKNFMFEKFLFYTVLCLISFYMITEFGILMIRSMRKKKEKLKKKYKCSCCKKNLDCEMGQSDDEDDCGVFSRLQNGEKADNELKYTRELFRKPKPVPFFRHLIGRYLYDNRKFFRFSKEFINTNLIAFILLYYITCLIIRKSNLIVSLSSNLFIIMINFIFKLGSATDMSYMVPSNAQINNLISSLYDNISSYIITACCFTTLIYVIQLFLGIKSYHRHILNGYRGVYEDIPSPKKFSNVKLAASSLHYSGYAIGYLLWGYLILFEVSLVSVIIVKFLIRFYFLAENIAKVVLPLLTIYLLKRILIWYLCRYFITKDDPSYKRFVLKNRKFYFILNHFNFFFDCFLGSFVCFMRMTKSGLAALFFMPRLDYSIFGRFLERKDMGFISYVSFIHMEVNQTHPVKLAFCELLCRSLYQICHKENSSKQIRNKWFLFYTLIKNPSLRRLRKGFLFKQSLVPKVETFQHFVRRQKRKIFNEKIKRRSKSVPCITEEAFEDEKNILNSRVPPTPSKRNRFINYNKDLNSTISTENTTISLNSPNRNYQPVFFSSPNDSQKKFSNRII